MNKNLLVELFVEELPPKALKKLGEALSQSLLQHLKTQGLANEASVVTPYASPRRLAVHISDVATQAADKAQAQKLMPATVGLDANGNATPALLKKLTALGADGSAVAKLRCESDGKADILFYDSLAKGATLADGLQKSLEAALAALPIPKVMTYQLPDGWSDVKFVRPAHGLVALHGTDVVPITVLGLKADSTTKGHRFEAAIETITLNNADSYTEQLATEGAVIASFAARREEIVRQLKAAATIAGATPIEDDALLDEVTALVERPNVLIGQFEEAFLEVPQECLILTMKANQKYFPLLDGKGKLTNKFLIVSNIKPADPSAVIEGNERVVRPRLADAKFFFDQDHKKTLESRVSGLNKVVYHNKLGTQGERTERVRGIARAIAEKLDADVQRIDVAAKLAKTDLLTDMVGEFPELQGIMGRYYALNDGLDSKVADAIEDHYKPRFAGDSLPRNQMGIVLALADKLETLAGMFGIGQAPTGDKDPFALRRHALGVIRLLVEQRLSLSLLDLIDMAISSMPSHARGDWAPILQFTLDRATGYFKDQGFDARAIASVLAPHGAKFPLGQLPSIMDAATRFISSSDGEILAAANKRITNILKKSGFEVPFGISPHDLLIAPNTSLFQQDEERHLFSKLLTAGEASLALRANGQFAEALSALIPLSTPVRGFFDKVMVNVEQPEIRDNRITLLQHARAYMNLVADLSLMAN